MSYLTIASVPGGSAGPSSLERLESMLESLLVLIYIYLF